MWQSLSKLSVLISSRNSPNYTESKKFTALHTNDQPPVLILSQINPTQTLPSCFFKIRRNIFLPIYTYLLQTVSFLQFSPPKLYKYFTSSPYMPHAWPIPSSFLMFGDECTAWNSSNYILITKLISFPLSKVQTSSTAPYPRTPSVYVPPSM